MDILGVGPIEIILILILGLVVFGPERLPEIGRSAGRMLAKVLAWQQQSPEAQMIQQMRNEFDQEIVALRDEIVRARQQLDASAELKQLQQDTTTALNAAGVPTKAGGKEPVIRAATGSRPTSSKTGASSQSAQTDTHKNNTATSDTEPQPTAKSAATQPENGTTQSPAEDASPAPTASNKPPTDLEALTAQLQTLTAEMKALQDHLRARGMLDADWQSDDTRQEVTPS